MKITDKALKLTKRFAEGAPCEVNFKNIENTMFWPFYEVFAKNMGLTKITVRVVKKYWFEKHNYIVSKRMEKGQLNAEQSYRCMVRIGEEGKRLFCIHGGIIACNITKKEKETIQKHIPSLRA